MKKNIRGKVLNAKDKIVKTAETAASFKNLWIFFILIVMALLTVTVVVASALSKLVNKLLDINIELSIYAWTILFSVLIGAAMSVLLGQIFFVPILKLSAAMKKVSGGDFNVRLTEKSVINEIRVMNGNFNKMTKELAATEMLQSDFVSNVSHEFKTPICLIEGYANLLLDEKLDDDEKHKCIDKILLNTKRLSDLVGNVLLLSRIDNQNIAIKTESFRLDEQIRQCIVMLSPKWEEKSIEIDAHLQEINYNGNAPLLAHVWLNLLDNAIKFNREGGKVYINLTSDDEDVVISVADEGTGIDDDAKNHIYDKFFQCDSSHKSEGNGLGLSLVKRILDGIGGTIKCSDREGGGTEFTVYLPGKNN